MRDHVDTQHRDDFRPAAEVLYVFPDGTAAYSPDGEGLIAYDSLAEAREDHPDDQVRSYHSNVTW